MLIHFPSHIDLLPLPPGEGWGEGVNTESIFFIVVPLILSFSLREKGPFGIVERYIPLHSLSLREVRRIMEKVRWTFSPLNGRTLF